VPPTQVGTIAVPTVIMWGERDDLLPRADASLLNAAIPDSRLSCFQTPATSSFGSGLRSGVRVMSLIERVRGSS